MQHPHYLRSDTLNPGIGKVSILSWIIIALGGALGALTRYGVDRLATNILGPTVIGTFTVNIIGSFLMGLFISLASLKTNWHDYYNFFLVVGFCGSFTTFSAVTIAGVKSVEDGDYLKFTFNVLGSFTVGLLSAYIGIWLGKNTF